VLVPINAQMFDFLWIGLGSMRPIARHRATTGEEFVWVLASLIFPIIDLVFSLVALSKDDSETVSAILLGLPIGFAVLTLLLCRKARATLGWSIQSVLVCFVFCLGAGFAAAVLSMF
jgi:hypothetical protein